MAVEHALPSRTPLIQSFIHACLWVSSTSPPSSKWIPGVYINLRVARKSTSHPTKKFAGSGCYLSTIMVPDSCSEYEARLHLIIFKVEFLKPFCLSDRSKNPPKSRQKREEKKDLEQQVEDLHSQVSRF